VECGRDGPTALEEIEGAIEGPNSALIEGYAKERVGGGKCGGRGKKDELRFASSERAARS